MHSSYYVDYHRDNNNTKDRNGPLKSGIPNSNLVYKKLNRNMLTTIQIEIFGFGHITFNVSMNVIEEFDKKCLPL